MSISPSLRPAICAVLVLFFFSVGSQATTLRSLDIPGAQEESESKLSEAQSQLLASGFEALSGDRFAASEAIARDLTKAVPEAGEAWHLLGLALANQGDVDAAIAAMEKAAALYTLNAHPLLVIGELELARGNVSEARVALEAASERDPSDVRTFDLLSRIVEAQDGLQAAVPLYATVALLEPNGDFFPTGRLVVALVEEGKTDAAIAMLDHYIRQNQSNAEVHVVKGRLLLDGGQLADAAQEFTTAAEKAPEDPQIRLLLAQTYSATGNFEGAIDVLRDANGAFPENADVLLRLGIAHAAIKEYDPALAALDGALVLAPNNPAVLRAMSRVQFRMDRSEEAMATASLIVDQGGATDGDLLWRGSLSELQGDRDAALADYEKAASDNPENWVALNNAASLLAEDDPQKAVELGQRAASLAPDERRVQMTLGWAYFGAGDVAQARPIYETIVENNPKDALSTYRLGRILVADGDEAGGLALVEKSLELDPEFFSAEDAKALLVERQ